MPLRVEVRTYTVFLLTRRVEITPNPSTNPPLLAEHGIKLICLHLRGRVRPAIQNCPLRAGQPDAAPRHLSGGRNSLRSHRPKHRNVPSSAARRYEQNGSDSARRGGRVLSTQARPRILHRRGASTDRAVRPKARTCLAACRHGQRPSVELPNSAMAILENTEGWWCHKRLCRIDVTSVV